MSESDVVPCLLWVRTPVGPSLLGLVLVARALGLRLGLVVLPRVRTAARVLYLLVLLSDELLRLAVNPPARRWDGEVRAALPGQLAARHRMSFKLHIPGPERLTSHSLLDMI